MKVSGRVNSIRRQIAAIQDRTLSPEARARMLADRAEEAIAEAAAQNRAVLGRPVHYKVAVDGREGAAISSVKPDGRVVANFDLLREVLEWIGDELVKASPRLTGKYSKSHVMEVDGRVWDGVGPMPDGDEFRFYNRKLYARKIEPRKRIISEGVDAAGNVFRGSRSIRGGRRNWQKRSKTDQGQSSQAPDGVYAAVAAMARQRYGDVAKISYTVKNDQGDTGRSHPTIVVRMI